ncbi:MAG: hypothetical protein OHK0050_28620 [Roseiflexaceae bacterium]
MQRKWRWLLGIIMLFGGSIGWFEISLHEFATGQRLWPWSAYAFCGRSKPTTLPTTVRIGLYEEFPQPMAACQTSTTGFPGYASDCGSVT